MIESEALAVFRKVCAYQPNQPQDELTAQVWAEALAPYELGDALEAVTKLGTADRQPGVPWLIEPRDVASECRAMRSKRLAARRHLLPQPPAEAGDDVAVYLAWLRRTEAEASLRNWQPPAQLEAPTRGARAVVDHLAKGTVLP